LIANLGTEIYYAPNWIKDKKWEQKIEKKWNKEKITEILESYYLKPQNYSKAFVVSYYNNDEAVVQEIEKKIDGYAAKVIHTKKQLLDIIPKLAGKGNSARYLGNKLDLPVVCCGDSENDEEMLKKSDYGIMVGNAPQRLKKEMFKHSHIYVAKMFHANGVIEGLIHHGFVT
jgi:hydroxymethylpyrimidine pyrophosphatase-like HAD family hydrolase